MFPSASCQATVFISRRRFTVSLRLRESPGSRDPFGAPFGRLQYLKKKLFFCSLTASFQSNSIEIDTIQFSVKNAVCLTASHIVDGKSNGGRVGCRCCRFESPPYRRIIFSIKSNFFNAIWFAVLHSTSWDFSIFFFLGFLWSEISEMKRRGFSVPSLDSLIFFFHIADEFKSKFIPPESA